MRRHHGQSAATSSGEMQFGRVTCGAAGPNKRKCGPSCTLKNCTTANARRGPAMSARRSAQAHRGKRPAAAPVSPTSAAWAWGGCKEQTCQDRCGGAARPQRRGGLLDCGGCPTICGAREEQIIRSSTPALTRGSPRVALHDSGSGITGIRTSGNTGLRVRILNPRSPTCRAAQAADELLADSAQARQAAWSSSNWERRLVRRRLAGTNWCARSRRKRSCSSTRPAPASRSVGQAGRPSTWRLEGPFSALSHWDLGRWRFICRTHRARSQALPCTTSSATPTGRRSQARTGRPGCRIEERPGGGFPVLIWPDGEQNPARSGWKTSLRAFGVAALAGPTPD